MKPAQAAALKRWTLLAAGWGFMLLGIVGLFVPVLQGILFITIGLITLTRVHPWARAFVVRLRRKFPAANRGYRMALAKARRWTHRDGG